VRARGGPVEFDGVTLDYDEGRSEPVIDHLDLKIEAGEFFVIVGPSGCGKSTLLRLVAGFLQPNAGTVAVSERPVDGPSHDRAMVFQSVDGPLFEWLDVRKNIEFGLRLKARATKQKFDRSVVDQWLRTVGLTAAEKKLPPRAVRRDEAARPDLPGSSPSARASCSWTSRSPRSTRRPRRLLQDEVVRLWKEQGGTFLYVTHDIREACLLGQRIAVMRAGPRSGIRQIHDIDLPYPRDEYSAEFAEHAQRIEKEIVEEVMKSW
jgi:NitT/TauT family transport system ATP-binding protein